MALGKHHRLPARAFQQVFERGKTVRNSFFFLKVLPTQRRIVRAGVSVPTKSIPRAVDRTHIRRIVMRVIEPIVRHTTLGYDIVVVAQPSIMQDSAPADALREAFQKVLIPPTRLS